MTGGADTGQGRPSVPTVVIDVLVGRDWQLVDGRVDPLGRPDSGAAGCTITFDGTSSGQASGSSGCNTFRMHYRLVTDPSSLGARAVPDEGSGRWIVGLEHGPAMSTRMSCPPAVMESESVFLEGLGRVDRLEVGDRDLVLGADGVELRFVAMDPGGGRTDRTLPVGTWEVVSYRSSLSVRTPVPTTMPRISFAEDGSVSLETGCNTVVATIAVDGDRIVMSQPFQTLKACPEPEGVMDQEADLARALVDTTRIDLDGERLVMTDDDGHRTITGVAVGDHFLGRGG